MAINLISFGRKHGGFAELMENADAYFDLRKQIEDPNLAPELRYLTWRDQAVIDAVMGVVDDEGESVALIIAHAIADAAAALQSQTRDITLLVACQGGRHRSPRVVEMAASLLRVVFPDVNVVHRDDKKPVVQPTFPAPGEELRVCIDADCPECGWAERWFAPGRQLFGCSKCDYTSTDRNS